MATDTTTAPATKRPATPPLEQIQRALKKQRQAIEGNSSLSPEQRTLLTDFFVGAEVVFSNPPTTTPVAGSAAAALVAQGASTRASRALFFGKSD